MTTKELDKELYERVQVKLEENLKRSKTMSSDIRKRNNKSVTSNEEFVRFFQQSQEELEKGIAFIQKIEEDPSLVFTDIQSFLSSRKGVTFALLNHWREHTHEIRGHDFQSFLAYIANRHFQHWLQEKGVQEPFEIGIRNPMQFPSIFAIYHEDVELIQLDILKSWYGIRNKPLTDQQLLIQHEKELQRIDGEIQTQLERIEKEKDRRDHPLKHYKGIKNFLAYLFINKKKLHESFNKLVEKEERLLEKFKEEKAYAELYYPYQQRDHQKRMKLIEMVEPFLKEYNYEFMTDKYKLY